MSQNCCSLDWSFLSHFTCSHLPSRSGAKGAAAIPSTGVNGKAAGSMQKAGAALSIKT